ncbi:MAG: hypothetical protein HY811_04885 [Planctomycetes bacterium]|nr:hypothetical protein [Planctomycetota bacterium]
MDKRVLEASLVSVALLFFSFMPIIPNGAECVRADIVQLDTGEEYNGKVTEIDDDNIRLETIAWSVVIPKYRILRIVPQKTIPEMYAEKLKDIAEDDAVGHYKLALWCKKQGWKSKMQEELEFVITINPDHEGARRALGFKKLDGEWVTEDEYMIAKGFIKQDGKWVPRELLVEQTKLKETKEKIQAKEKEQKKKEELFERTARMAVVSALTAQHNPNLYARKRRGGSFEFEYNYEDGSGFSTKASAYSEDIVPDNDFYAYNPVYVTDYDANRGKKETHQKQPYRKERNTKKGFLENRKNESSPATDGVSGEAADTTKWEESVSELSQTENTDKQTGPDVSQPDSENTHNDKGHGNDSGHFDEDNPGQGKGKNK